MFLSAKLLLIKIPWVQSLTSLLNTIDLSIYFLFASFALLKCGHTPTPNYSGYLLKDRSLIEINIYREMNTINKKEKVRENDYNVY